MCSFLRPCGGTIRCRWGGAAKLVPFSSAALQNDPGDARDGDSAGFEDFGASVVRGGDAISVRFPPQPVAGGREGGDNTVPEESIFDAAWLWSSCPSAVLPDSGQRTRSPGEFPARGFRSASIVFAADAEAEAGTGAALPVPPPPPSACHPIRGNILEAAPSAQSLGDQALLRVEWEPSRAKARESKTSFYDLEWLRRWRYDVQSLRRRRKRTEVTREDSVPAKSSQTESGLFEVDFGEVISNAKGSDGLLCLYEAVFRDGAAFVRNVPSEPAAPPPVAAMGRALGGSLSHDALYGDVFHVRSTPSAINIAYTSAHLRPHQDLAYYESPPGIQLLHCVAMSPDLVGGESIMVDCLAAAHELRRINPDYFETLVRVPATFAKQRRGAHMTYRRPHIVVSGGGREFGGTVKETDGEIVGVNWSPPFEGPLSLEPDQVRPYYRAYAAFEYMLDKSLPVPDVDGEHLLSRDEILEFANYARKNTWECRLKPGEMLVFSNRRMVHGRKGFYSKVSLGMRNTDANDHDDPIRHLVGCYTDIDDTLCRYRDLLQQHRRYETSIFNVGNGTSFI